MNNILYRTSSRAVQVSPRAVKTNLRIHQIRYALAEPQFQKHTNLGKAYNLGNRKKKCRVANQPIGHTLYSTYTTRPDSILVPPRYKPEHGTCIASAPYF